MKEKIESITNILLDNLWVQSIYHAYSKEKEMNDRRWRELENLCRIDSIREYDVFAEQIRRLKYEGEDDWLLPLRYYFWENSLYGYYHELVEYSGIKEKSIPYIGRTEHGVRFGMAPWAYQSRVHSYGCQGVGRIHEIRDKDNYMPIFVLGPYLHYARSYYSDQDIASLKNQLGKTLLVFPSHSIPWQNSRNNSSKYLNTILEEYGNNFDTILVCVYWNDINAPDIRFLQGHGAKLVSAGFSGDQNFCRRLKTIIALSDHVVTNDIGTNIGYCIYMGKPVELIDTEDRRISKDPVFEKNYRRFKAAFSKGKRDEFSPDQKQWQESLYEEFWGGEKHIFSSEELLTGFSLMRSICADMHYWSSRKEQVISQYMSGKKDISDKERIILCRLLQRSKGSVL